MIEITTAAGVSELLGRVRGEGRSVGFVPTMGFLHEGHLSLITESVAQNDFTVVSIFVNPLQFGEGEDLDEYPRDLQRDAQLCRDAGVDALFVPEVGEMYPKGGNKFATSVNVAGLSESMEGAQRPTHFAGVATVVSKLFNIVGACRAYFGEKDFQQLALIKTMVSDLCFPVEVVGMPIVREVNGLAMSSRNKYLSETQFEAAGVLFRSLSDAVGRIEAGERDAAVVIDSIAAQIGSEPLVAEPDYITIVDAETLAEVRGRLCGDLRICLAARVGKPRLLDNIGVSVSSC